MRKYSDKSLIVLLKANYSDRYKEREDKRRTSPERMEVLINWPSIEWRAKR